MSDYLVELGKVSASRKIAKKVGLSLPVELKRSKSPRESSELNNKFIKLGGGADSPDFINLLTSGLVSVGAQVAEPNTEPGSDVTTSSLESGDVASRLEHHYDALVFEGTDINHPDQLSQLHQFFQPRIGDLNPHGRVVVIARLDSSMANASAVAASYALQGFARSLAKELGKRGSTAHVVSVEKGAEERLLPLLIFLLSERSAFISGQSFQVTQLTKADTKTAQALTVGSMNAQAPLKDKLALVTGAARGIGLTTAAKLAAEGARVLCLDRKEDEALLNKSIGKFGGIPLLQDLREPDAAQAIVNAIEDQGASLDIVVHNAGITRDKTLGKMSAEQWESAVDINLSAVIRLTTALLAADKLSAAGRVVCLSSVAGIAGNFGQTNYAASKSGIIGYVKAMAQQLAGKGITVNAIAPGFIETRMTAAIPFATREGGRRLSNLSQGGLPEDIAEAITFLALPGSVGLSGEVVRVCGGSLLGA